MEGFGKLYYPSGNQAYSGYWKDSCFHGEGYIVNEQMESCQYIDYHNISEIGLKWKSYIGNFNMDYRSGQGLLKFSNGE